MWWEINMTPPQKKRERERDHRDCILLSGLDVSCGVDGCLRPPTQGIVIE
jgi:hypothetical protein